VGAVNYAFADGPSRGVVSILQGIQAAVNGSNAKPNGQEAQSKEEVERVGRAGSVGSVGERVSSVTHVKGCEDVSCANADVDSAAAVAKAADATVVVLGDWFGATTGWPLCKGSAKDGCESESHDRTAIELPGKQVAVVQALRAATTAPLVCVLVHGGAVALGAAVDACDAIVDLWVPGQMGGTALADILFGEYSPAGRSPITFYTGTSDLPPMDKDQFNEYPNEHSNGTTYRHFIGKKPTFGFGWGLSYTTFEYSKPVIAATAAACDAINMSVTVTNTGKVASDEVVQVYVNTPKSSVPSPRIRLAAFKRVRSIAPGQSVVVQVQGVQ
jgi:beta-glucosidase